jgi:hypothetical protein
MAQKQVFISHISAEAEIARRLKQRLDNDFLGMLEIFVSSDRETIRAGEKWLDQVDRALRAADAAMIRWAAPGSISRQAPRGCGASRSSRCAIRAWRWSTCPCR